MRATDEPDVLKLMRVELDQVRKRLRGMAMISRGIVPKVVLSQRAVERMLSAAHQFMADETGEAMVGFVVEDDTPEGLPTIYVLDTISPDETAVRRSHTFQQGDALQDEIIWWLQENWHFHRERHRGTGALPERFDVPLRYLGDWHKQPGSMIQPSHGDHMTALAWLDDDESDMDFLLVPIVTVGHLPNIGETDLSVNYINIPMENGRVMRVDWWYVHRDVRVFQPVHPKVVSDAALPQMMKYSWHVVDPDRLYAETLALEEDGQLVSRLLYECDGEAPLECCFFTIRQGGSSFFLFATQYDYPQSPPLAFAAPFVDGLDLMDPVATFHQLWAAREAIEDPPGWEWTPDKTLLDFLAAIEAEMGLRPPVSISIPVLTDDDETSQDGRCAGAPSGPQTKRDMARLDDLAEEEAR